MNSGVLWASLALLACAPAYADPAAAPAATPPAAAPAPGGPPTLDDFYADPVFESAKLSPNGRQLAYVWRSDSSVVMVKNLDTGDIKPILNANVKGITVDWLEWKDDNRIILGLTLLDIKRWGDKPNGDIESFRYGQFLVAIDRDGKNMLQLLKGNFWNSNRGNLVSLLDRLKNDPDHILAAAPDTSGYAAIWKVNIRTGEAIDVVKSAPDVTGWRTDSTGAVVVRYRVTGRSAIIEGRATEADPWTQIATLHSKDLKALDDFEVMGAAEKPSQLYVTAKPKDASEGDVRRLRIYDIATKTLSDPIWPSLKYDIGNIVYDGDTSRLAGVCYTTDVSVCDFSDKPTMANFRGLLNFFGGDRNITPISFSNDGNWWLLDVSGPNEPSTYYLYDKSRAKIDLVAERFQKVADDRLGIMQRFSYLANDSVQIPGYLTRPPNAPSGPLPLIVMPHGGPEARDAFVYDIWSQYLATRGYLVFQPNFRGSSGYGVSYAEAGYRHWNSRMADDITDGVHKLIETGQADPQRICIFGASFGGYAALMAGASHPELYKCVVSWAGITDLPAFLRFEKRDHDSSDYDYWVKLIGDPQKDADLLKAASPTTYAATYRPPVLLLHGEDDDIVDLNQSKIMNQALKQAGRDVKLVTYVNEGHPDFDTDDQKAALKQVTDFIEAHIAPATPPTPVPTPAPTKSAAH